MKKLFIAGAVLLLLGTASISQAKIGLGYDGYNGAVSVKYMGAKFGLQGMANIGFEGAPSGAGDNTVDEMSMDFTVKFLFPFIQEEKLHINGVLGIGIQNYTGISHVKDASKMNTGWLLGISPEYYVMPNLSFETTFGIGGTMYGKTKVGDTELEDDYMAMGTFGSQISISTGVAFHYYFAEKAAKAE